MWEIVSTPLAPKAIGPYSQAVRSGQFLFLSGQIGLDPNTGTLKGTTIEEQTDQVLKNIDSILRAAGLSFPHLIKTTVFLTQLHEFSRFNQVYERYVTKPFPARSTIEVTKLPKDALVEIESIAFIS